MKAIRDDVSWRFLDEYRGKFFKSNWPTLPQMFRVSVERWPDNVCFVDFDGNGGTKQSYTYTQVWRNVEALAQWMISNGIKNGDHGRKARLHVRRMQRRNRKPAVHAARHEFPVRSFRIFNDCTRNTGRTRRARLCNILSLALQSERTVSLGVYIQ